MVNKIEALDKKENTTIVFGSAAMKLDDFKDMVDRDPNLQKKMKVVEEELKKY